MNSVILHQKGPFSIKVKLIFSGTEAMKKKEVVYLWKMPVEKRHAKKKNVWIECFSKSFCSMPQDIQIWKRMETKNYSHAISKLDPFII